MKEVKPRQLKAAVMFDIKQPLRIVNLDIPPLEEGQVLVKILFSGVCRSQLMELEGGRGEDKWLPHFLGHEGSGKVVKVGEGVTTVKPNDHIIMHWRKSAGIQSMTPKYKWDNKIVNAGWITTFNQ